jgi:hypothetical protein
VYLISTCVCIVDRSSMRVGVCVCGVRRMFRYYSLYSKWRALKKKKKNFIVVRLVARLLVGSQR